MERLCGKCARVLPADAFYDTSGRPCKDCRKKQVAERLDKIRSEGCCLGCRSPIEDGTLCTSCRRVNLDRYYANRDSYLVAQKNGRNSRKLAAFNAYGGPQCQCCGEQHVEFLTIDHIGQTGAAHRKEMLAEKGWNVTSQSMSGTHLYRWLKQNNYPPGFRVLCMNCNFAMGHSGYCPHNAKVEHAR